MLLTLAALCGVALCGLRNPHSAQAQADVAGTAADPAPTHPGGVTGADPASVLLDIDDEALPLSQRVAARWFELRESLRSPTGEGLDERLGELQKLRESAHLRGLPGPARGLAADGFRLLEEGDRATAAARFQAALEIDPDAADARLGLAAIARKRNPLSPAFVSALWQAAKARVRSLRSAPYALGNWAFLVGTGLLVTGLSCLLALMLRRNRRFRHDVEEWLKHRVDAEVAHPLAWVALLLPLLLTFDLYWACLYWAVILWPYFGSGERVAGVIALACCAATVPCWGYSARLIGSVGDPYTRAASSYLEGFVDEPTLEALDAHLSAKPDDRDAAILRALVYQRNGEQRAAIQFWKQLAAKRTDAVVLNNLGNAYYRLDEKDNALDAWNRALEADSSFAQTHYNLSLYYFAGFVFNRRDEHFNKAKQLAAEDVDRWVREGGGVVDAGIESSQVRRRLFDSSTREGPDPLRTSLRSPQFLVSLAAVAAGFLLARGRRGTALAQSCDKCGQAFCSACKPGKEKNALCLQCVHLFLRKDGVSPQMRSDKMRDISRYHSFRRIGSSLLSLVLPGTGQIYRGEIALGLGLLLCWSLAASWALLAGKLPPEPGLMGRAAVVAGSTLSLTVGGLVWFAANALNVLKKG